MPYIGNELATQFQAFTTQTITGDGSTGYTLSRAVANGKELLVYINNVKQEEGSGKSYQATGTTITFTEAVASTDSCYVVFLGSATQTVAPPDGSVSSAKLDTNIAVSGTLGVTGAVTANAGISVDNITIDGTEIDLSSGNLTLDVEGNIILDSNGGLIQFEDNGTEIAYLQNSSNSLQIQTIVSDADIKFRGNDGGSGVDALILDMSAAGLAIFNAGVAIGGTGAANTLDDYEEGSHTAAVTMSSSGSVAVASNGNEFSYTKIGRLVVIVGKIIISSVSSPVGNMKIALPFAAKNNAEQGRAGAVISVFDNSAGSGAYYHRINGYAEENTSFLFVANVDSGGENITPAASDEINLSFSYITD
jgi:hypothetical protein